MYSFTRRRDNDTPLEVIRLDAGVVITPGSVRAAEGLTLLSVVGTSPINTVPGWRCDFFFFINL